MGNLKQTATDSVLESLMTNGTLNASTTEDLGLAVMARRISTLPVLLSSPGTQLSSGLLQPSTITKLVLTASCTPFLTQAWADHPAVLASVACTSGAWVPTSTPHFSRVWTTLVGSTARGGLRRMGQICATSRSLVMVKPPSKQRSWHSSKMVKLFKVESIKMSEKKYIIQSKSQDGEGSYECVSFDNEGAATNPSRYSWGNGDDFCGVGDWEGYGKEMALLSNKQAIFILTSL